MPASVTFIEGGTITTPLGFLAGATYAGIKTYAEDKLDLGLLLSERPAATAGVYTTSAIVSPSVTLTRERVSRQGVRGLVVNSGIANACVGTQGYTDALEATSLAAGCLGLSPEEVVIGSTGLIGVELPMALIRANLGNISLTRDGGGGLASAITTTDSHPKQAAVSFRQGEKEVHVGGIAKGAGMIHPDMATMLAYLTTDADVDTAFLQKALKMAADASFNNLSIDGDSSTNDTTLIFANGAAGASTIKEGSPDAASFQEALEALCIHLTKELALDGEGATRLIEVTVDGAVSNEEARRAARTVVSSTLVKSAVHGADPNWGRIVAALGRSGAQVVEEKIALYVNDVCIMEDGRPIPFHKDSVIVLMRGGQVSFRIRLGLGDGAATAWGCDLSEDYVTFNSAYTT